MASINLQGDTSGSISISAPSVAGSNTLTLPATTQTLATQNALGVRNLIINGDMRIAQRGTSATGITNSNSYNTIDRYQVDCGTGPVWSQEQSTDVPTGQGFANSLKMSCTTAETPLASGSRLQIRTRLEGQNLQHLKYGTSSAESLTLSFWVKSNKTGTYVFELYNVDATRQVSKSFTIDSADTWEKKTITYDGDTVSGFDNDNGNSLQIGIYVAAGSNYSSGTQQTTWATAVTANRAAGQTVNLADSTSNYINITGLQLEIGSATPFEHRPYDMELARCQRYYEISTDGFIRSNTFSTVDSVLISNNIYYTTTKRAAPTVYIYDIGGTVGQVHMQYNGSGGGSNTPAYALQIGIQSYQIRRTATVGVDKYGMFAFTHRIDAEL